ncbi:hypothetical protein GORHZ_245_00070 [Gordonia rhizosphera NBRC 16068]|uniref:Uncharacterized protein n=2 Tax=Gordonia rhizosphera TaxID=83341 RepID=K6X4P9_9ACTN|nr:hypothetical protein GORHZ_245_00070 [Gordonia rhizosphera NBRC 16068]
MPGDSSLHGPTHDRGYLDRMLIAGLGLVGAISTIVLSAIPMTIGVDSSPVVVAMVGSVNTFGYVALVLLAARAPIVWGLVSRLCLLMVAISVLGAVVPMSMSGTAVAGTSFLVAMSSLMAFIILGYALLDRDR